MTERGSTAPWLGCGLCRHPPAIRSQIPSGGSMTHPIDLPDTFPDHRDTEDHSGGAVWLVVVLVAAFALAVLVTFQ